MTTTVAQQGPVVSKLIVRWEQVCQKLVALVEEIPAKKFDYRPGDGVRTLAEVLRHVAFWNYYVADAARGRKVDETANELPKDKFSTRAQIVDALKRSGAEATEALRENSNQQMAEMLLTFIEHNCEHYGQLVVYARLNGIVPPVSRG